MVWIQLVIDDDLTDEWELTSISPSRGSRLGGTVISIGGNKFPNSDSLKCLFGEIQVDATYISETLIKCTTPETSELVSIKVKVTSNDVDSLGNLDFEYVEPFLINDVSPSIGMVWRSTVLEIKGEHFYDSPQLACRFDGQNVAGSYVSPTQIRCPAPRILVEGDVEVLVTLDGSTFTALPQPYRFQAVPAIAGVHPLEGHLNTRITFSGSGFIDSDMLKFKFGDTEVSAEFNSDSSVACLAPDHSSGYVEIQISINGQEFVPTSWFFRYIERPLITPDQIATVGAISGGTIIDIAGEEFTPSDKLSCYFEGIGYVAAVWKSTSKIHCMSPASETDGPVKVFVSGNREDLSLDSIEFVYIALIKTIELHPTEARVSGGTLIRITTSQVPYLPDMYCSFGSKVRTPVIHLDDTQLLCLTPKWITEDKVEFDLIIGGVSLLTDVPTFAFVEEIGLDSVSPNLGSELDSTVIRLSGSGFLESDDMYCIIESLDLQVPATYVSPAELTCVLPPSPANIVYLRVLTKYGSDNSVARSKDSIRFEYVASLKISSLVPNHGSKNGNTEVKIVGEGFSMSKPMTCRFGESDVEAVIKSSTLVSCRTPKVSETGSVPVSLYLNDELLAGGMTFEFIETPTILSVTPAVGDITGTTILSIKGTGFVYSESQVCRIGETVVPALYNGPQVVSCVVPQVNGPISDIPIAFASNGQDFVVADQKFTYIESLIVEKVSPLTGPTSGGTVLTFTGSGVSQHVVCRFDGFEEQKAVVLSTTSFQCTSPPSPLGLITIQVANNADSFVSFPQKFNYVNDVILTSIQPSSGVLGQKTAIIVTGIGFSDTGDIQCRFDDQVGPGVWIGVDSIECQTPIVDDSGTVAVYVSLNGQDWSTNTVVFHFIDELSMEKLSPASGVVSAASSFYTVVTGTGFQDVVGLTCSIGATKIFGVFLSATSVRCRVPPTDTVGSVKVSVSNDGWTFAETELTFEYLSEFTLDKLVPNTGNIHGGETINVYGDGHVDDDANVNCMFSEMAALATRIDSTQFTCVSPGHTYGPTTFYLTVDGVESTSHLMFDYVLPIKLHSFSPAMASATGETVIKVSGENFAASPTLSCRFGTQETDALYYNTSFISCIAPPMDEGSEMALSVSNNGVEFVEAEVLLKYESLITLSHIEPSYGVLNQVHSILIHGSGFKYTAELSCRIKDVVVTGQLVSSNAIRCWTPAWTDEESVSVAISLNGVDFIELGSQYQFLQPRRSLTASPVSGTALGGTEVWIEMENLQSDDDVQCRFDGNTIAVHSKNSTHVACITPTSSVKIASLSLMVNNLEATGSAIAFEFYSTPMIFEMYPSTGVRTGGTTVSFYGAGFLDSPGLICRFCDVQVAARWRSTESIDCLSPAAPVDMTSCPVAISLNSLDFFSVEAVEFTYKDPPKLDSIDPITGPTTGGNSITITGTGFEYTGLIVCRFSNTIVKSDYIDGEHIRCKVPSSDTANNVEVKVSLNGQEYSKPIVYKYAIAPMLESISPATGSVQGNDRVTITGTNFLQHWTHCIFDETAVPIVSLSTTQVVCDTPRQHSSGAVNVHLGLITGEKSSTSLSFRYYEIPKISHLHPAYGAIAGGTRVIVYGRDFPDTLDMKCIFKGNSVDAKWISSSKLECISPASSEEGSVDLELSTNGADKYTVASVPFGLRFNYVVLPVVESISPADGSVRGGTTVHITGHGFNRASNLGCKFGSLVTPATSVESEQIACVSPRVSSTALVSVDVVIDGGDTTEHSLSFEYKESPVVDKIKPRLVSLRSSDILTIDGKGFVNNPKLACRFDTTTVSAVYISENQITCEIPTVESATSVVVQVTNNGQDFSDNDHIMDYVNRPYLYSVYPNTGAISRGGTVDLFGAKFPQSRWLECQFSDTTVPALWISETQLSCSLPVQETPGSVTVQLFADGVNLSSDVLTFEFHEKIAVESLSPEVGFSSGQTEVVITGGPFATTFNLTCRFDYAETIAIVLSSTQILCTTPPMLSRKVNQVTVLTHGIVIPGSSLPFTYIITPHVLNVLPVFSSPDGSQDIQVTGSGFVESIPWRCVFGTTKVPAVRINDSVITCENPKLPVRDYHLSITCNGLDTTREKIVFSSQLEPIVFSVSPSTIPSSGGQVTILGAHFLNTMTLECLAGDTVVRATYIDNQRVKCHLPTHEPSQVEIRVSNNAVEFSTSTVSLRYVPDMRVGRIEPAFGSRWRRTRVAVFGTSLIVHPNVQCQFGDIRVPSTVFNSTYAECYTDHYNGNHNRVLMHLVYENQISIGNDVVFDYISTASIEAISPQIIQEGVENVIRVSGSGFTVNGSPSCKVVRRDTGESEIYPATVSKMDQMQCHLGRLSVGLLDLYVGMNGIDFDVRSVALRVASGMILDRVTPAHISEIGGSVVMLDGVHFFNSETLSCAFGTETPVDALWVSSTRVVCTSPRHEPGSIPLRVCADKTMGFCSDTIEITYIRAISLTELSPSQGTFYGNSKVLVKGSGFQKTGNLKCMFGDQTVAGRYIDASSILCASPPSSRGANTVQVAVSLNGYEFSLNTLSFHYVEPLQKLWLPSTSLNPRGESIVSIHSETFNGIEYECLFGYEPATPATLVTATELTCISPAHSPGSVALRLVEDGVELRDVLYVEYRQCPIISSISSKEAPAGAETSVFLYGLDFTRSTVVSCQFGDENAIIAHYLSNSEISCQIPSLPAGDYQLKISCGEDESDIIKRFSFKMYTSIKLNTVEPNVAFASGSTRAVTITGRYFRSSVPMNCDFGGQSVGAAYISSTEIQCIPPPHSPGKVALSLVSTDVASLGDQALSNDQVVFTYLEESRVLSVVPSQGTQKGGTIVKIALENAAISEQVVSIQFGTQIVAAERTEESLIQCITPPHASDSVEVKFSIDGKSFISTGFYFEFREPFQIIKFSPQKGPDTGGTLISFTSIGFDSIDDLVCVFGQSGPQVKAQFHSPTVFICESPRHQLGPVEIAIRRGDLEQTVTFTYYPQVGIADLSPKSGPIEGGRDVVLRGTNFQYASTLCCRFDTIQVDATYINSTSISCLSPRHPIGEVQITVSINGHDYTSQSITYRYIPSPIVHLIKPARGPVSGGSAVTVRGNHFSENEYIYCHFGDSVPVRAENVTPSELKCTSPKATSPSVVAFGISFDQRSIVKSAVKFHYFQDYQVTHMEPTFGSENGGTVSVIHGDRFPQTHIWCKYGNEVVSGVWLTAQSIRCTAPPGQRGRVALSLAFDVEDFHSTALTFDYIARAFVDTLAPRSGSIDGGTYVSLLGSNFAESSICTCIAGTRTGVTTFLSASEVVCITPPAQEAAIVDIELICDGTPVPSTDIIQFTYTEAFRIDRLEPLTGPTSGGTQVTIHGDNFYLIAERPMCQFGTAAPSQATVVSRATILCETPFHAVGNVPVFVSMNGVDFVDTGEVFRYILLPQVFSISPTHGIDSGETKVVIRGHNFVDMGQWKCRFGGAGVTPAYWISSTQLECRSPRSIPCRVPLEVSFNDHDFTNNGHLFTFHMKPSLWSMYPSRGPISGGTKVSLHGNQIVYSPLLKCKFGGDVVEASFNKEKGSVECMVPPSGGNHVVEAGVSVNGIDFVYGSDPLLFHYTEYPSVESISPVNIPSGGNSKVKIIGKGFKDSVWVQFDIGDTKSVRAAVLDSETIEVTTPVFQIGGEANILVSMNNQNFERSTVSLFVQETVRVSSIRPTFGANTGNTLLTVTGSNFPAQHPMYCIFGEAEPIRARYLSSTQLTCETPKGSPGDVSFEVSTNLQEKTSSGLHFTYIGAPDVFELLPSFGPVSGGTQVMIRGKGFQYSPTLVCEFDTDRVPAFYLDSTTISCTTSSHTEGSVPVQVLVNNKTMSGTPARSFTFRPWPTLEKVYPNFGNRNGGDLIRVEGNGFEDTDAIRLRFGSVRSEKCSFESESAITCISPEHDDHGYVEMFLSMNDADYLPIRQSFLLKAPAIVAGIRPSIIPEQGGSLLYIAGRNLADNGQLDCMFTHYDGSSQTTRAILVSSKEIQCHTPVGMGIGNYTVELMTDSVVSSSNSGEIQVYMNPTIERLHPLRLPTKGGQMVTVYGSNFIRSGTLRCRFDHVSVIAMFVSEHQVKCAAPAHVVGGVGFSLTLNGFDYTPSETIEYIDGTYAASIVPASGSVTGKTDVTIEGNDFDLYRNLVCVFGDTIAESTVIVSSTMIQCVTPKHSPGRLSVYLRSQEDDFSTVLKNGFVYTLDPIIASVSPSFALEYQSYTFSIRGANFAFSPTLVCRFGSHSPVSARWISTEEIECESPKVGYSSLNVEVSNNGQEFTSQGQYVTFYPRFSISRIRPSFGSRNGGTMVRISGSNFRHVSQIACRFNSTLVMATKHSDNEIECTTPSMRNTGSVLVELTANGLDSQSTEYLFTYTENPRILSVFPTTGKIEGGTKVSISGENFQPSYRPKCKFGSKIVSALVISDTVIECRAPAASETLYRSTVALDLSLNGGIDFTFNQWDYQYQPLPVVTSIDPKFGSEIGSTSILVYGEYFVNSRNLQCVFGANAVAVLAEWVSTTRIRCLTPKYETGTVDVRVSNNRVEVSKTKSTFTYTAHPMIRDIQPAFGARRGGTRVNVTGSNFRFTSKMACRFGRLEVQATTYDTDLMTCIAPTQSPDVSTVDLAITFNGIDYIERKDAYVYQLTPRVTSILPRFGQQEGGTDVIVYGSNFGEKGTQRCFFGSIDSPAEYLSEDSLLCRSPPSDSFRSVRLEIGIDGTNIKSNNAIQFSYVQLGSVFTVSPTTAIDMGGTLVSIYGTGFHESDTIQCAFKSLDQQNTTLATYISATEITCPTPALPVGQVSLSILDDNVSVATNVSVLDIHTTPVIDSIAPVVGSRDGGTMVTVHGSGFVYSGTLSCIFDLIRVPAIFINPTTLRCYSPAAAAGERQVRVSINGADFSPSYAVFTMMAHVVVRSATPLQGAQTGGTQVDVVGDHFIPEITKCYFGTRSVEVTVVSATRLTCIAPPSDVTGPVFLRVSANGIDMSRQAHTFEYFPNAFAESVYPMWDLDSGGSAIRVTGLYFRLSESLSCFFGSTRVNARWKSKTEIECTAPPLIPGIVDLSVSNDGILRSEHSVSFTFIETPMISSVAPLEGPTTGGTTIVVQGSKLERITECHFGVLRVPAHHTSSQELRCVSPPQGIPGAYDLTLSSTNNVLPLTYMFTYASSVNQDPEDGAGAGRRLSEVYDANWKVSAIVPVISSIYPTKGPTIGGASVWVRGYNITNSEGLSCKFGDTVTSASYRSPNLVVCITPYHAPSIVVVEISNDGVHFSFSGKEFQIYSEAFVNSIEPSFGPVTGNTLVTVYGAHFSNTLLLHCRFGDFSVPVAKFISSNEIKCLSPKREDATTLRVSVSNNNHSFAHVGPLFTYLSAQVSAISPSLGAEGMDTDIIVTGFNFDVPDAQLRCKYDEEIFEAELLSPTEVKCKIPATVKRGTLPIQISTNGGVDFTRSNNAQFQVTEPLSIMKMHPVNGPAVAVNTMVTIHGSGFVNSVDLGCRFDTTRVGATWVDESTVRCRAPPHTPGIVPVSVTANRIDFSTTNMQFLFTEDVTVRRIHPERGLYTGYTPVFVSGNNFENVTSVACKFGSRISRATFISRTMLSCIAPSRATDIPNSAMKVSFEITLNGIDYTDSGLEFEYLSNCPPGHFCPHLYPQRCPNGTQCATESLMQRDIPRHTAELTQTPRFNFTLCPLGSFQPRNGQQACVRCPVGYFCPDWGLSKPLLCPAGYVCDRHGLRTPTTPCPAGHFCMKGTKSAVPSDFDANSEFDADPETQILTFNEAGRPWEFIPRIVPATGSRRIEHPPLNASCENRLCSLDGSRQLLAERPYPCEIGMYCRRGVASHIGIPKNFSTPQRCFPGFFCPRGSTTAEGEGPCPGGYYCPTATEAFPCRAGEYCPGVGNQKPLECYPGTFNPHVAQSNCTICPTGNICPGWGRSLPEPCPAGFVCSSLGLSAAVQLCPAGYYCEEGTLTNDPSDMTPYRPKICSAGTFCLGGVAHNMTIDWIPNQPEGATAPQTCTEGTFCEKGSSSPSGSGNCFSGHYCPPGIDFPLQSPIGTFSEKPGSVAPTMCFPGTYAPLKSTVRCRICPAGYSCPGYGTYIPAICPAGNYRSVADAVTCRFCPPGTWGTSTGLTDISSCEPCPKGRVCGVPQMINLNLSSPCPSGHVCGEGTNRQLQFRHQCPAGYYCFEETDPGQQYNLMCEKGHFCRRGTKGQERNRNKCPVGSFCPDGTSDFASNEIRCPSGTSSVAGVGALTECAIKTVAVCDKDLKNSYYEKFVYHFNGEKKSFDSTLEKDATEEIIVVKRIVPINETSSASFFNNDTVDAQRTCPPEGHISGGTQIHVIGRNFFNTSRLTCGFRKVDSRFMVNVPATYVSRTRAVCRVPPFSLDEAVNTSTVLVHVSNFGVRYSDTGARYQYWRNSSYSTSEWADITSKCLVPVPFEEGEREYEKGWFMMRGLSKAKILFDMSHIPTDLVYDEHYRVAISVSNSTCEDQQCDARRVRKPSGPDIERSPCRQPIQFSEWFDSQEVRKNTVFNVTLFALEDVLFKVEIHILYGLYASTAPFFLNTTSVDIAVPSRSKAPGGGIPDTRPLAGVTSFEEALVPRDYAFVAFYHYEMVDSISIPLNLPPRFKELERGRVLVSHNTSQDGTSPVVRDTLSRIKTDSLYWALPFSSETESAEMVEKYRETFHEMYIGPTDEWTWKFEKVALPYLPFLSNCRGFDSYVTMFDVFESEQCQLPELTPDNGPFGRNWWRRDYPPFPHQDDIRYVGPQHVGQVPVSDWCELDIQCAYEEDLPQVDITPRWFEASSSVALFDILHEPVTLADFMMGGQLYDKVMSEESSDVFIPVTVDRSEADTYEGGCTRLCIPRNITMDVSYYQLSPYDKRLIKINLIYDDFDENLTRTDYNFHLSYHPLDFIDLIIAFAFDRQVFITLFVCIGLFSCAIAAAFWFTVRMTTRLRNPPKFRFWSYFALTAPGPIAGIALGMAPVCVVVFLFWSLLNGYKLFDFQYEKYMSFWLLDGLVSHYTEEKVNPQETQNTRNGRTGLCFLTLSMYLLHSSTRIFIPKKISIQEKINEQKNDQTAIDRSIWSPTMWKRSNMVFTSIMLGLFCTVLIEFSFWEGFGENIWFIIIGFEFMGVYVEGILEEQLKEALLLAPLAATLGLTTGLITFGAEDFQDFLLGYTLDFGIVLIQRVYLDAALDAIFGTIGDIRDGTINGLKAIYQMLFRRTKAGKLQAEKEKAEAALSGEKEKPKEAEEGGGDEAEDTVEPIIDQVGGYAMDTLSLMYQPVLIVMMIVFRYEMQLPVLYGINENHMEYYLWFSLVIIFFQITADIFVHNVLELFHGWKIHDYLVYTRYRFLQRETRWKGMEGNEDECIEEGMRSLDQMCFSSQFYMMSTFHMTAVMLFAISIEMMIRVEYNFFGDPAALALLPFVILSCISVKRTILFLAVKFEFWKVKHEDTAWHALPDEEDDFGIPRWEELEKIKGASHEAYLMNQKITSETFRFKFLNYNRPWIISQLPSILTPRTLRRGKPYLLTQFQKILGSLNPDVSSDSDDDGGPQFGPVSLKAPSRNIIRVWLAQARRRQRLRTAIQPIINQNRKVECEVCLSRRQLQVEMVIPLQVMGDKFEKMSKSEEFDVKGWKEFFKKHQKFKTMCMSCTVRAKNEQPERMNLFGRAAGSDSEDGKDRGSAFPQVYLNAASDALIRKWYRKAQDRVFGKSGKRRAPVDVSDDEDEQLKSSMDWAKRPVKLNAASTAIARKWFSAARERVKIKTAGKPKPLVQAPKPQRKKPAGASSKRSRQRRK